MKLAVAVLLLLTALWCVTLWRAHRAEQLAESSHPPSGRFVEIDGQRVHYWMAGDGPDLILIHGSSGNLNDYTFSMAGQLTDRYRVIVLDRPGLGYSDQLGDGGASIADQAALLARAADEIGVRDPMILGNSYGGAVALAWAIHRPREVAGLVLVAAASNPWSTGLGAYYTALSSWWGRAVMAPLLTAWVSDDLIARSIDDTFAPQAMPDGYVAHFGPRLSLRRVSLRENALQRAGLLAQIEAQVVHYPELTMPAEILHGQADSTVSATIHSEPLSRQMPNADLTLLPGIGHMVQHSAEAEVIAAIDRLASRAGLR